MLQLQLENQPVMGDPNSRKPHMDVSLWVREKAPGFWPQATEEVQCAHPHLPRLAASSDWPQGGAITPLPTSRQP